MAIGERDAEKIKTLAKEGKRISRIVTEDYPEYDYWDVYSIVYGSGGQAGQGVKRKITNRLNQLASPKVPNKQDIIVELDDLCCFLYDNYKKNQEKLNSIRKILG